MSQTFKKITRVAAILFIAATFFITANPAYADVYVNGYFRKDGTYVRPHYRSDPDGIKSNNWSYPGNTNPYTGETAGGSRYDPIDLDNWEGDYDEIEEVDDLPSASSYRPKLQTWTFNGQTFYTKSSYDLAVALWDSAYKEKVKKLANDVLGRNPYTEEELSNWAKEKDIYKLEQQFRGSDEYKENERKKVEALLASLEPSPIPVVAAETSNKSWWKIFINWLFGG